MKILFIGDYSSYHATMASELRRRGHECTVVSDGSRFMQTARDISLVRRPGWFGSVKYLYDVLQLLPQLKGYDVVQLISTHFLQLRPGKLSYILRNLKRQNGRLCLSLCGTDHFYVRTLTGKQSPLEYSEYGVNNRPTDYTLHCEEEIDNWLLPVNKVWAEQLYNDLDGAVSALYEYHRVWEPIFGKRLSYTGIGVDTRTIEYAPLDNSIPLRVLISVKPESARIKGIYLIEQALQQIAARHPGAIEMVRAESLSFTDWLAKLRSCHVLADQLYSYTPATAALQAMAMGRVTLSGGEEEYYRFIGEENLRPVINADPRVDNLADALEPLLLDRDSLLARSRDGRKFVENHNDIKIVTDRLLAAYDKL